MTVAIVGYIGKQLADNRTGIHVAIFAAISAHQIDFSQQCRAYSMYLLLVAIGTLSLICLVQKESLIRWAFFLISLSLSLGTHYFAAIFIVQAWAFLFFCTFRRGPIRLMAGALLFVLLCIPWIVTLRYDLMNPTPTEVVNRIDFTGLAYTYLTAIEGWTIGPSQVELVELPKSIGIIKIAPWAIAALVSTIVLAWYGFRNLPTRFAIWLTAMLVLTPLLGGLIAIAVQSSYVGRYVAWIAVPLSILCGAGAKWHSFQLRTFMTYLFVALNLLSTYNRLYVERYDRENYRAVADHIRSVTPEAWVVTMSHYMSDAVDREMPDSFYSFTISLGSNEPDDWNDQFQRLIKSLQATSPEKRPIEIFLIVEWMPPSHMLFSARQYLIDQTSAQWDRRISGTIDVYRIPCDALRNWLKPNLRFTSHSHQIPDSQRSLSALQSE